MNDEIDQDEIEEVAVIGLAGRFPEAPDIDQFWSNLCNGVDALREFSEQEMEDLGIPAEIYGRDNFIRRGTQIPFMDEFDAGYFGFTPREASLTDPQARIFLETCATALEHSGYNPTKTTVPVGVFAGSNPNDYATLLGSPDPTDSLTGFDQLIATDKDFLATRVSHRLNLTGPALNIQTACSTSLVTVHVAARNLLDYQCDMALAGGVSVNLRQGVGYFAQQGMILSPDGFCRAFDVDANGTTLGQACGVVVLKRLSDALEDGDSIYAVIKASALNNDGSSKISYTAPSEDGQTDVISLTHSLAGVNPDDITYVETHGTGTKLGDPIEVSALTRAFRQHSDRIGYCALGSVKTNVGHTDAAAGVTGLIKTVLSLHHKKLPPSLHYKNPNPELNIETSPFFVNDKLRDWTPHGPTRLAGISAFGIGGTNAHAVLSEAPALQSTVADTTPQILALSAMSAEGLGEMQEDLATWLDTDTSDASLADAAYTLQTGRRELDFRLCQVQVEASGDHLRAGPKAGVIQGRASAETEVVFMFSGQGSQYASMGRDLYATDSVFRETFDQCADAFAPLIGEDLRTLCFADAEDTIASEKLRNTQFTQASLFSVEYSVAKQLMAWGLKPTALLGHSIGEYAALCVAEVLSLSDAIVAVATRGRLMQSMHPGSMLAVHNSAQNLGALPDGVEIAAINTSNATVVSGPTLAIEAYQQALEQNGGNSTLLQTSHAFHSSMMAPMLDEFKATLASLQFNAPTIRIASNVTGQWLTEAEATDPEFWCRQIRQPVLFAESTATILNTVKAGTFVEVGPGRALAGFVRECSDSVENVVVANAVRHLRDTRNDAVVLREAVGRAWVSGANVDWLSMHKLPRRRIAMPTYRYQRKRYWAPKKRHLLDPAATTSRQDVVVKPIQRLPIDQWLYLPSWKRVGPTATKSASHYVIVSNDNLLLATLSGRLRDTGATVDSVSNDPTSIESAFQSYGEASQLPDTVIHMGSLYESSRPNGIEELDKQVVDGLECVLATARAMGSMSSSHAMRLDIVTSGAQQVTGHEVVRPEASALLGPAKVIPLEYGNIEVRLVDADPMQGDSAVNALVSEVLGESAGHVSVALRGGHRWVPDFAPLELPTDWQSQTPLRKGAHYMILGGLGGVGLSIAQYLAREYGARLTLTSRSGRPPANPDPDDQELQQRIAVLNDIEANAASVQILAADVADLDMMTAAVASAEQQTGVINGVIVAAGVADMAGAIHQRTIESNRDSIKSKVDGSFILDFLFRDKKLDFMLLSSSIATALFHNRFAQVGYVTGNSYAEAYGLAGVQSGTPVYSVAWDDWMDLGMSVRAAKNFADTYGDSINLVDEVHSFTPAEGVALFERILGAGQGLVYVSTTDLRNRVKADLDVVSPFLQQVLDGDDVDLSDQIGDSQIQTIIQVWENVLGFEGIEPEDDFFELGGDSLQVARMVDRLSRLLKMDIPLNTVFDARTPVSLDQALTELAGGDGAPAHDQSAVVGPVKLSPGQMRYLNRGSPHPEHFNVSTTVQPRDGISKESIKAAIETLFAHHDALRLRLNQEGGVWTQESVAADWDERVYTEHDLSKSAPDARRAEFTEVGTQLQSGFVFETGPLFRTALFDFGEEGLRLLIVAQHLVADRLSLLILLDHLDLLCANVDGGAAPQLPTKTMSFAGWSAMLVEQAKSGALEEDLNRWQAVDWTRMRPMTFDFDVTLTENKNSSGMSLRSSIAGDAARTLMSGKKGQVDRVLLAALARALTEWTGGDLMMIDVMQHGRRVLEHPADVSRTIGYFLTYAAVLIDTAAQDLGPLAQQIDQGLSRGWALDVLRQAGTIDAPSSSVLFNFVGQAIDSQSDSDWTVCEDLDRGPETILSGMRDHPIAMYVETTQDSINIRTVYSTKLHTEKTVKSLIDRMIEITNEAILKA